MNDGGRFAGVAIAATAVASCPGPNTACQCGDDVVLHAQLKTTTDALSGANVWVCKNDACFSGKLSPDAPPPIYLGCDPTPCPLDYDIPAAQVASDGNGTYGVDVRFPNGQYTDGDVYQLAIASASGNTLISRVQKVSYDSFCNGICVKLSLDLSP